MFRRHRHHHLFSSRQQSIPGLVSFILGAISCVTLILVVWATYHRGGKATQQYGAVSLLCLLFALVGLITGILARREPDRIYTFAWIGIALCAAAVAFCFAVMYQGLL